VTVFSAPDELDDPDEPDAPEELFELFELFDDPPPLQAAIAIAATAVPAITRTLVPRIDVPPAF